MHSNHSSDHASPAGDASIALVLWLAKRLHRAATSQSLATALPVLRRLLAAGVIARQRLPELFECRAQVRRKHLLRMLSFEAGYGSWVAYRSALAAMPIEQLPHLELIQRDCGYFNAWFSSESQARDDVVQHGGRVLCVGTQAVVVRDCSLMPEQEHHE